VIYFQSHSFLGAFQIRAISFKFEAPSGVICQITCAVKYRWISQRLGHSAAFSMRARV